MALWRDLQCRCELETLDCWIVRARHSLDRALQTYATSAVPGVMVECRTLSHLAVRVMEVAANASDVWQIMCGITFYCAMQDNTL